MSKFVYFECPECGFDSIQRDDFKGSTACPLCAGDSGHDVGMSRRPATETDQPEGFDARKGARAEIARGEADAAFVERVQRVIDGNMACQGGTNTRLVPTHWLVRLLARAEIARLKESAAVTERRACDMASSLGEDIARLTAQRDAAILEMSRRARAQGEAEGKLMASELAGAVEGWQRRAETAEQALANLQSRYDALLAERTGVSEAMGFETETDVLYNLEGALIDLDRMEVDPICRKTIRRVIDQLALCQGCPPVGYPTNITRCVTCPRHSAIRSAAKTEDLP